MHGYGCGPKRYGRQQRAHRVAWIDHHDRPIPKGGYILHHCDVRACVNPEHLYLGTHQDNMDDMNGRGRGNKPRGEANGNARLTTKQVDAIRNASGITYEQIAALAGCSQGTVSNIRNGVTRRDG